MEHSIKLSELIDKLILCMSNAQIVGKVAGISFDKKLRRGRYVIVKSADQHDAKTKYIALRHIAQLDSDALVVRYIDQVGHEWDTLHTTTCPYNAPVYTHMGKHIGTLTDVALSHSNVIQISINNNSYNNPQIVSFSNQAVFVNDSNKPIILKSSRNAIPTAIKSNKVYITKPHQVQSESVLGIAHSQSAKKHNKSISLPTYIDSDYTQVTRTPQAKQEYVEYNFLKGRQLLSCIKDNKGAVLFEIGTTITEEIIKLAKEHSRLVHLAIHS